MAARRAWDRALELGTAYGYRNAQVTVIAPTGTIGLVMDCDTTGIEPDFALVKFKKLAGGGYFKIINQSIPAALRTLGYTESQIQDIVNYCVGRQTLQTAPFINHETLRQKGFDDAALARMESGLAQAFEIQFTFNKYALGEDFCREKLGLTDAQLNESNFNMLKALGFTQEEIAAANDYCCGTMTVEGAPHLKAEHLSDLRLCQPLWSDRPAIYCRRCAHPHDGGGTTIHQRRHQQDDQHAGRCDAGRGEVRLFLCLEEHGQGRGAVSRRLEVEPAVVGIDR